MNHDKSYVILSLYDFWDAFKQSKKIMLWFALFAGAIAFLYQLNKPILFTAEGTFKIPTSSEVSKAFELFSEFKSDHFIQAENPKQFLRSYPVLEDAVRHLNLQGHLSFPTSYSFPRRLWYHFKTERAYLYLTKKQRPASSILAAHVLVPDQILIPDRIPFLELSEATYEGELSLKGTVHFDDEEHFTFFDARGKPLCQGAIGEKISWEQGCFTLCKKGKVRLKGRSVALTWIPLSHAVHSLEKSIEVKRDKENTSLLHVRYWHQNRHFAASVVNAVMKGYQHFVQREGYDKISKQLSYLSFRQGEMESQLDQVLEQHRKSIEECLGTGHFLSLQEEIAFMGRSQAECEKQLLQLKTEMLRLSGLPKERFKELQEELPPQWSVSEEFQKIPLEKALDLLALCQVDVENADLNRQKYENCLEQLRCSETELASFASTFEEHELVSLFENIRTLSLELLDENNWTPKEKERKRKELDTKKQFLTFHLTQLKEGALLNGQTLRSKRDTLQHTCLHLLLNEYRLTQEKLEQLAQKSLHFAEKWLAEKKIDMSTTLHADIVSSISKMIEMKNMTYHTECMNTGPLVYATAPVLPRPPHLAVSFALGGFSGVGVALLVILFQCVSKGALASSQNLKALGYHSMGSLSSPFLPPLAAMSKTDAQTVRALAHRLSQHKSTSSLVLCTSQSEMGYVDPLIELMAIQKEKILCISFDAIQEPGLFSYLETHEHALPIQTRQGHDFLPMGMGSIERELLLYTKEFQHLLENLQHSYKWIFFQIRTAPENTMLTFLIEQVDEVICQLTTEPIKDLSSFPEHTLYLSLAHSHPVPSPIPLLHIEAHLNKLKKRLSEISQEAL